MSNDCSHWMSVLLCPVWQCSLMQLLSLQIQVLSDDVLGSKTRNRHPAVKITGSHKLAYRNGKYNMQMHCGRGPNPAEASHNKQSQE